jgi:broad specificity phosphatase PhoE
MTGGRRVVHLLRHGEVENPGHILYGRLPGFSLSDRGVEQAKLAAEFLSRRDVGYLVSSPLERARQTAQPLAEACGLPVHIDERLIEAGNRFEGRAVAGGHNLLRSPASWWLLRNPFRPSWGEPYPQIAARVLAAVRSAANKSHGHEAVCVSHQLPIVVARRRAQGRHVYHDPRRRQCSLGSVTTFTLVDDEVVSVDYAEPAGHTPPGELAGA